MLSSLPQMNILDNNNTVVTINRNIESKPAVDIQNVFFAYDKKNLILNNLSLRIPEGKIYALLGSSGSGKTTLLKLVLAQLKPKFGILRVFGRRPGSRKSNIPGSGVGYMPQETALFNEFSIEEILTYFGILYHINKTTINDRITHLIELLNLPKKSRKVCELSGGQQRLTSIAVTMIHKPPLLILDEPTVGVDSLLRCRIWEYLENLCKNEGSTVIITTHYIEEARTASTVGYINCGRLLVQSNPHELLLQHKCSTLEDVFLKLCKERENSENIITIERNNFKDETNLINDKNLKKQKLIDFQHIKALMWKNHIRIMRNPMILILFLMLPVIQISLFCLSTGGKPSNLNIAIYEPKVNNSVSNNFIDHLDKNILSQLYFNTKQEAIDSVRKGESYYAMSFTPNFSETLETRILDPYYLDDEELKLSEIKLYPDMTNTFIAPYIFRSLIESFQNFLMSFSSKLGLNPSTFLMPVTIEKPIYGSLDYLVYEFAAPGVIIATIHVTTMLFSAFLIVLERKDGHLDRAIVSGVKPIEILISHVIMLFVAIFAKVIIAMVLSFVIFDIPLRGSIYDAFGLIFLQSLQGLCFGLLISVICFDEAMALICIFGITFPLWFTSAVFWPIESVPDIVRKTSYYLPLTQPIEALRLVLLRGWSIEYTEVIFGYTISVVYSIVLFIITVLLFKNTSKGSLIKLNLITN